MVLMFKLLTTLNTSKKIFLLQASDFDGNRQDKSYFKCSLSILIYYYYVRRLLKLNSTSVGLRYTGKYCTI